MPDRSEPSSAQTSDEKVWQSPGCHTVETAPGVPAYALADCRPPPRRPAWTAPTPPHCVGANVGDYAYYAGRARATDDFHGLGAFLIMNERQRDKGVS